MIWAKFAMPNLFPCKRLLRLYCAANAAAARALAISAFFKISSVLGRLASTSAGINPSPTSFVRHFLRSSKALSGLRSLLKRDLAAALRSLRAE